LLGVRATAFRPQAYAVCARRKPVARFVESDMPVPPDADDREIETAHRRELPFVGIDLTAPIAGRAVQRKRPRAIDVHVIEQMMS
jgi:hypothetical protein